MNDAQKEILNSAISNAEIALQNVQARLDLALADVADMESAVADATARLEAVKEGLRE